jgi:hypothetical protein
MAPRSTGRSSIPKKSVFINKAFEQTYDHQNHEEGLNNLILNKEHSYRISTHADGVLAHVTDFCASQSLVTNPPINMSRHFHCSNCNIILSCSRCVCCALGHCRRNIVATIDIIFLSLSPLLWSDLVYFSQIGLSYGYEILHELLSNKNIRIS